MANKKLIGKRFKIVSDNDNYDAYRDKILVCTHADNEGPGYDSALYPEMLCDFECEDGTEFPFALYDMK